MARKREAKVLMETSALKSAIKEKYGSTESFLSEIRKRHEGEYAGVSYTKVRAALSGRFVSLQTAENIARMLQLSSAYVVSPGIDTDDPSLVRLSNVLISIFEYAKVYRDQPDVQKVLFEVLEYMGTKLPKADSVDMYDWSRAIEERRSNGERERSGEQSQSILKRA